MINVFDDEQIWAARKNKRVIIIKNEQHNLLPEQESLVKEEWSEIDFLNIPADGWSAEEIEEQANLIYARCKGGVDVLFLTPLAPLLKLLASWGIEGGEILVFFNPHREKKELPGGKVIFTVPETGWMIV